MRHSLLIFIGGGVGSVLRYWTILATHRYCPANLFPVGVFVANMLGTFALGFLFALPAMKMRDSATWMFTATGVLGGYTTFSPLANDSWQLLLNQHPMLALVNAFGSLAGGIVAAGVGWRIAHGVFG